MISRTKDVTDNLMFPLKGQGSTMVVTIPEQKQTNTNIMTVEPDSLTRLNQKILIVDDHPFIIQGYKMRLQGTNRENTITV
jgi:PleD family two-component response regulator